MKLYDYWRSSAAYRVRIALNLKRVPYEALPIDLRTGAQSAADYKAVNPQGLVPAIEAGGQVITQSTAIMEWLEDVHPQPPLLPADPAGRAAVRAMMAIVACDIPGFPAGSVSGPRSFSFSFSFSFSLSFSGRQDTRSELPGAIVRSIAARAASIATRSSGTNTAR